MGLYPQPNNWSCGPFALKYALIMLGKFVHEKQVSRIAGTHWWVGTDEIKLSKAAKAYDCEMKIIRRTDPLRARRELLTALKQGRPSLLCVDGWSHWITAVGTERGKFICIDSTDAPVVCVHTWESLKNRWVYKQPDQDDPDQLKTIYDLHVIIPKFRVRTHARLSLKRARFLRRPENSAFAQHWDEYFTDLTRICTPRTPRSENVFAMGELLRRHGAMIRSQVIFWHGTVTAREVSRILRNMQFIADSYDLVVRTDDEKKAIAALSVDLALWAASKHGVDPFYETA
jgi:hypothetical protein